MSHAQLEALHEPAEPSRAMRNYQVLFWVIAECWADEEPSWRRWSEVFGPFSEWEKAEAMRLKLRGLYAQDRHVNFEVVRRAEGEEP